MCVLCSIPYNVRGGASLSLSLSLFDVSVILHFFTICTWPVLCCSMAVGKRQGGVEV
ncbi:hypothetical protein OAV88_03530 [bacterium]|nr:hypothetical protein [bacterium]